MATRYKDRITILEDAEIEELYGRPRFTHDERIHYFALTPEERAAANGHYSLASRVLFILQAGYFKAKTLFFSFEIDEVADDVKHVLQQHYPQYHDAALKSAIVKQTRHAQQHKLLELYGYRACAGAERAALGAKADQVVRISAKPIYVFQALVQYLESHRVVAPGYSFLQDVVSRALGKERGRLTSLLDTRLDEPTRKALDRLYLERDGGYGVTPLKQDPKDFSRNEMRREMARCRSLEPLYRTAMALLPDIPSFLKREPSSGAINPAADARSIALSTMVSSFDFPPPTNCCFISGSPAIAVADTIINSSISLIANPWSKHRYVARGRHPGTRIYVS
jgi:hypothetical protein